MTEQEKAARFRAIAATLRLELERTRDAAVHRALAELAGQYDALAEWLERKK